MKPTATYPLRFAPYYPDVVAKLQALPRTGWLQWDIQNPETVWEHTIATRELGLTYQNELGLTESQFAELLDMIEIHDWAEAIAGDEVILGDEANLTELRQAKQARELTAMETICTNRPDGEMIWALYNCYAHGSDAIARLAKQLEKLQAVHQAHEYELTQSKPGLTTEFVHYTRNLIHHPTLTTALERIAYTLTVFALVV